MNSFDFANHNQLASFYPYYIRDDQNKFLINRSFPEITSFMYERKDLDIVALIELLNKNYIFGDRTLIKGLNRSPWMGYPDFENNSWRYFDVPSHFENIYSENDVVKNLYNLLKNEVFHYLKNAKSIGILLSGGMDSRVLANVIDDLVSTGELNGRSITGLTWGDKNSRDVVYAKNIANRLKWDWKHFEVDAEMLWNNIIETSNRGCEFSGIHLHALKKISMQSFDCVIAGSYGDSIGRAEYSGKNVTDLRSLSTGIFNYAYILNTSAFNSNRSEINDDIIKYHEIFPQEKSYQQIEQDYQLHYMRRMLNPCMEIIGEKMPFYQLFTQPAVFGYMWSLHPKLRTNNIYKKLFSEFSTNLLDIPWARTGLIYGSSTGIPDQYSKKHHSYGKYIAKDLYVMIESEINQLMDISNGLFNRNSVNRILKHIKQGNNVKFDLVERATILASLSMMIKKYNIHIETFDSSKVDWMKANLLFPYQKLSRKITDLILN